MNSKNLFQKAFPGFYALVSVGAIFYACTKERHSINPAGKSGIEMTTGEATNITGTGATIQGLISADGGSAVTLRGVCWSKSSNPKISDFTSTEGSGSGRFNISLKGLTYITTYYVRAFAANYNGIAYGNEKTFITSKLPGRLPLLYKPPTSPIADITNVSASMAVTFIDDGNSDIIERGVCWSISPNPTVALSTKTTNGPGKTNFFASLTDLVINTIYYVKAYATNGNGTGYGAEWSFTTLNLTPVVLFTNGGGVSDIDGTNYSTIIINGREWMKSNLKTTRYRDGSAIPTGLNNLSWQANRTSGAYAIYNNETNNDEIYGKLYNFYAVVDPKGLCPTDWHVPTDTEWTALIIFLGEANAAVGGVFAPGSQLKAVSALWASPNPGATDESGFSALPGGIRDYFGDYVNIGTEALFWSSSVYFSDDALCRSLDNFSGDAKRKVGKSHLGYSVRCLKN